MALAGFNISALCKQILKLSLNQKSFSQPVRNYMKPTKRRYPEWFIRAPRLFKQEHMTHENKQFVNEYIKDEMRKIESQMETIQKESSVLLNSMDPVVWKPNFRRTGLIAHKIGVYSMWMKDGHHVAATLYHINDNQVIKYTPPEEYRPRITRYKKFRNRKGCLLVGSQTIDPSQITKEYYGIFKNTGVLPKKNICRFIISPEAALTPGTPLYASHFRAGDFVDIRGLTIDRGFQGVIKRWGFKGMPATHGVTKTHRRPGNIGAGGNKARVWPGTKMPGHMGNRWRTHRALEILRINRKYNVIWVKGETVGATNSLCYMYDTILPHRKLRKPSQAPPFPTHFPTGEEEEETYNENVHPFSAPTIMFSES